MSKLLRIAILCLLSANGWADTQLTEVELKWLRAAWPVLTYAEQQQLPIDIISQPEAKAGDVPFAMGFDGERCQLVLSMRGNPDAEAVLKDVPAEQVNAVIEAITAHEVAHCWRYVHGVWHAVPAGFVEATEVLGNNKIARIQHEMQETRREEAFADLAGLAWTLRAHPQQYAAVHAWFEHIRKDQPVAGSYHDTRVWIELAKDPSAFKAQDNPFEQARILWTQGLLQEK